MAQKMRGWTLKHTQTRNTVASTRSRVVLTTRVSQAGLGSGACRTGARQQDNPARARGV